MSFHKKCLARFSILYMLLTFVGFVGHVTIISTEYAEYKVVNRMELQVTDELPVPKLSLCFRYSDILDRGNASFGVGKNKPFSYRDFEKEQSQLTIKQIFNFTPRSDEVLKSCNIRIPKSTKVVSRNETQCETAFKIQKYFMQEHICYDLESNTYRSYPMIQTTKSLHYLNCIYLIQLAEKFDSAPRFIPIAYIASEEEKTNPLPFFSRSFSKETFKERNNSTGLPESNNYDIYHTWTKIYLLPLPYTTRCSNDSTREICIRTCLLEELKPLNRVPYSEIITDSLEDQVFTDKKPIGPFDLENSSIEAFIYEAEQKCYGRCSSRGCNHFYTLTNLYSNVDQSLKWTSQFRIMTPSAPTLIIRIIPGTTLTEFVIYICSCLGIWFGINALSLNPRSIQELIKINKKESVIRVKRYPPFNPNRDRLFVKDWSRRWNSLNAGPLTSR